MLKFKMQTIINLALVFSFAIFSSCGKENLNSNTQRTNLIMEISNPPNEEFDPEYIGELHNYLYDSLAYNWDYLNYGNDPINNSIEYLYNVCISSYGFIIDDNTKDSLKNRIRTDIQSWLNNGDSYYEYFKPKFENIDGGLAGAAGGPSGVILVGTLGAVVEGALISAVETSFSDLIDSWFD